MLLLFPVTHARHLIPYEYVILSSIYVQVCPLTCIFGYLRSGHLLPLIVFNMMKSPLSPPFYLTLFISIFLHACSYVHNYYHMNTLKHSFFIYFLLISIFPIPSPPSFYSLHDTLPCCHGNNQDPSARLLGNSLHP